MEPFHFRRRLASLKAAYIPLSTGFTLIELVVVLAVISTVTAIALSSQSTFNKTLVLANTAYDIALTLHTVENFGIGSRALPGVPNARYGVHFQKGAPDAFIVFADTTPAANASCTRPDCRPGDYLYSTNDTLVQTYTLGNGIVVDDFCASFSGGSRCASTGDIYSLDIVFGRPNPDAFIRTNGSSYTAYTGACLAVSSEGGESRFVSIAASGHITANTASCP